jgi:plastocyanin
MRRRFAPAAVLVVTLVLGACGGDDASDADAPAGTADAPAATEGTEAPASTYAPNGEVAEVSAIDNTFRPGNLEVSAGTEVVFTNGGRNDHNIVPSDGSTDWGVEATEFTPGDTYSYVFTTPGTYAYFCSLHGTAAAGMIGTITVTG